MCGAYGALGNIIKHNPKLGADIIDTVKVVSTSEQNDESSLYRAYEVLGDIVEKNSEFSAVAFDAVKSALASEKNNSDSLNKGNEVLDAIIKAADSLSVNSSKLDIYSKKEELLAKRRQLNADENHVSGLAEKNNTPECLSEISTAVKREILKKSNLLSSLLRKTVKKTSPRCELFAHSGGFCQR